MSKNGKLKKARNVEKRRMQMQEAMECLPLKQVAQEKPQPADIQPLKSVADEPTLTVVKREPKQCSFRHCQRYVDPSCTVCPYCGNPLPAEIFPFSPLQEAENKPAKSSTHF